MVHDVECAPGIFSIPAAATPDIAIVQITAPNGSTGHFSRCTPTVSVWASVDWSALSTRSPFCRVDPFYRRGREVHNVRLFDTRTLCSQLTTYGFANQTAQGYGEQR